MDEMTNAMPAAEGTMEEEKVEGADETPAETAPEGEAQM